MFLSHGFYLDALFRHSQSISNEEECSSEVLWW
uniref:Uncharacterized protein n=1 Tax=Arundo donax TaxID=35708 RepID=A0A0A9FRL9_ARUDO